MINYNLHGIVDTLAFCLSKKEKQTYKRMECGK